MAYKNNHILSKLYNNFNVIGIFGGLGVEPILDQQINTSTSTGKLMFNLLGAIAEFETELRKERQTDGIVKAIENGVKFGAKSKLSNDQVQQLKQDRQQGMLIRELCLNYRISKASVYRLLD